MARQKKKLMVNRDYLILAGMELQREEVAQALLLCH